MIGKRVIMSATHPYSTESRRLRNLLLTVRLQDSSSWRSPAVSDGEERRRVAVVDAATSLDVALTAAINGTLWAVTGQRGGRVGRPGRA
jgi:hypothetical protein